MRGRQPSAATSTASRGRSPTRRLRSRSRGATSKTRDDARNDRRPAQRMRANTESKAGYDADAHGDEYPHVDVILERLTAPFRKNKTMRRSMSVEIPPSARGGEALRVEVPERGPTYHGPRKGKTGHGGFVYVWGHRSTLLWDGGAETHMINSSLSPGGLITRVAVRHYNILGTAKHATKRSGVRHAMLWFEVATAGERKSWCMQLNPLRFLRKHLDPRTRDFMMAALNNKLAQIQATRFHTTVTTKTKAFVEEPGKEQPRWKTYPPKVENFDYEWLDNDEVACVTVTDDTEQTSHDSLGDYDTIVDCKFLSSSHTVKDLVDFAGSWFKDHPTYLDPLQYEYSAGCDCRHFARAAYDYLEQQQQEPCSAPPPPAIPPVKEALKGVVVLWILANQTQQVAIFMACFIYWYVASLRHRQPQLFAGFLLSQVYMCSCFVLATSQPHLAVVPIFSLGLIWLPGVRSYFWAVEVRTLLRRGWLALRRQCAAHFIEISYSQGEQADPDQGALFVFIGGLSLYCLGKAVSLDA